MFFFFSSRRRHTRFDCDWSSDVCSSDLKPFSLLEEEAVLNLGRTYEYLQQRLGDLLKDFQLTPTQYNMLRILRGAGSDRSEERRVGKECRSRGSPYH